MSSYIDRLNKALYEMNVSDLGKAFQGGDKGDGMDALKKLGIGQKKREGSDKATIIKELSAGIQGANESLQKIDAVMEMLKKANAIDDELIKRWATGNRLMVAVLQDIVNSVGK